jgi:hypothetical protein
MRYTLHNIPVELDRIPEVFAKSSSFQVLFASGIPMTSSAAIVKQHIRASKQLMKRTLSSKQRAKALLIRAGILAKNGKTLAKPYR